MIEIKIALESDDMTTGTYTGNNDYPAVSHEVPVYRSC